MESNKKHLSEEEIQERILAINRKIDEELLDFENVDMERIDEYLCQIQELTNVPQKTEAELKADLQIIYKRADEYEKRKSFWRFDSIGVRAAGIAAAILVAFTCTMTVSAVRDPFVSFCINVYEKYTELFFDASDIEKAPQTIETVYTLGYVPEGYVEKECNIGVNSVYMTWINSDCEKILFEQRILDTNITMDNEYSNCEIVLVESIKIMYMFESTVRYYYWNSNGYCFYLEVPDNIAHDVSIELIQSLKTMN